jgi:hypothetical protein
MCSGPCATHQNLYICVLILLCMCVLILLYMCPHTAIYVSSYCYMCPLTAIHLSSYCYICVSLYMCRGLVSGKNTIAEISADSSRTAARRGPNATHQDLSIFVLILLCISTYESAYLYVCVLIPLRSKTSTYVSLLWYVCLYVRRSR